MTAVPLAEQLRVAKDLIHQCERRAAHLQGHDGQASIHVTGEDWAGLEAILATLEAVPAMLAVIEAARGLSEGHAEILTDTQDRLDALNAALAALSSPPKEQSP